MQMSSDHLAETIHEGRAVTITRPDDQVGTTQVEGQLLLMAVRSDSMAPTIQQGDPIVVVAGKRPETAGCGVYAMRLPGGGVSVVRVHCLALRFVLTPDNSRYLAQSLTPPQLAGVSFIGKVFMTPVR